MADFINPDEPTLYQLQVLVMPNGEILCSGRTIGRTSRIGRYLTASTPTPHPLKPTGDAYRDKVVAAKLSVRSQESV